MVWGKHTQGVMLPFSYLIITFVFENNALTILYSILYISRHEFQIIFVDCVLSVKLRLISLLLCYNMILLF